EGWNWSAVAAEEISIEWSAQSVAVIIDSKSVCPSSLFCPLLEPSGWLAEVLVRVVYLQFSLVSLVCVLCKALALFRTLERLSGFLTSPHSFIRAFALLESSKTLAEIPTGHRP
ncbi:unnamed protein product, partial [Phaeothamnion confervicola]